MNGTAALIAIFSVALAACTQGPAPIERGATCAFCRMTIASPRLAGQIVAPAEEPRQYDDIGCLVSGIARGDQRTMGDAAVVYVADHRTGAWVKASDAVFTRVARIDTPMGSHLIAHADAASRAADPEAAGGTNLSAREVFAREWEGRRDAR